MGCGASKVSSVVETTIPKDQKKDVVFHAEKEILPGIKGKETKAAVAFEIPLDDFSNSTLAGSSKNSLAKSLPKLSQDFNAKLANAEERWQELEKKSTRKKGDKPVLSSSKKNDPDLAKKLEEKENQAALNRLKEKERLAAKIAAQEERKKQVLERKKLLQEDEKYSVGGENESSTRSSSQSLESTRSSGSSKSIETETTDVEEQDESSYASSPESIKKIRNPIIEKKIRI